VTIPRVAEPDSIALEDANAYGGTVEGHAPTLVEEVEEDDPETPQLNGRTCFGLMILVTVVRAVGTPTIPPLELGHLRKKLEYVFSKSLWCILEVIDF
jgi:hypothetical protein